MTSLDFSEYPDLHDAHRCGSSPFVPRVDSERQHSCGSYQAAFDENGCNAYRPNYPDDLYIQQHGSAGLADCYNGVPPRGDMVKEGTHVPLRPPQPGWPATGYVVPDKIAPACREGFSSTNGLRLWQVAVIVFLVWLAVKFMKK